MLDIKKNLRSKGRQSQRVHPGHLWLEPPVLCHQLSHNTRTTTNPHNPMYVCGRCVTWAFNTTCAVHTEDYEHWWLSGCHCSVAEHWRLKPEVSWVQSPVTASLLPNLQLRCGMILGRLACTDLFSCLVHHSFLHHQSNMCKSAS